MSSLKRAFVVVLFAVGAVTMAGLGTTAVGSQKKPEGVPQIVHLDATAFYDVSNEPALIKPRFRVRMRGTIFVPENTRVETKYLVPFRNTWTASDAYGPFPRGQTVNLTRMWDVDAGEWNGKTFTAKLMATSSAGAVTREASVPLTHR